MIDKSIRFVAGSAIYYYASGEDRFYRDNIMDFQTSDSLTAIIRIREDVSGNLWILGEKDARFSHVRLIRQPGGDYLPDKSLSNRLADLGEIYMIHPEHGGVSWFGGAEGLLRFDAALLHPTEIPGTTLIRSVRSVIGDTLFF